MKDNREKTQKTLPIWLTGIILIILAVILAVIFRKSSTISGIIDTIVGIVKPFLYGVAFAFLLSPVYDRLRKHMHAGFATIICLIIILAVIFLLGLMIIPQLIASISQMVSNLPEYGERLIGFLEKNRIASPELERSIRNYTVDFGSTISAWFTKEVIPNIGQYAITVSSGIVAVLMVLKDVFIGIIIMVYSINMKSQFKALYKKFCFSVFSLEKANDVISESRYVKDVFSKFIVGKIIDSLIIGILTFIVISLFKMPYSVLIAVIVGVTNVIPYFGPFIGAIPCAILLLLVSPVKCLEFSIIILIIQQIDGNIIGPKILGEATGVSSFWVLFSIMVFGGLLGVFGMIIAVPAFAVIKRFINRRMDRKLKEKDLSTDTGDYVDLERVDTETHVYHKCDEDFSMSGESTRELKDSETLNENIGNDQDAASDAAADRKEDN